MGYSIMEMSHSVSNFSRLIDLFFPRVHGVHPSLTLRAAVVHACDGQDSALFDVSDTDLLMTGFAKQEPINTNLISKHTKRVLSFLIATP
jgi:hypothetical protein